MFISELFSPTPDGYRTEQDDDSVKKLTSTRKTRLTLSQIGKLRIMNDLRKVEHLQKIKSLSTQYTAPAAAAMPGM